MTSINATSPIATALLTRSNSGQRHDQTPKPAPRSDAKGDDALTPPFNVASDMGTSVDAERLFALRAAEVVTAATGAGAVAAYRFNHPAITTTPLDAAPQGTLE